VTIVIPLKITNEAIENRIELANSKPTKKIIKKKRETTRKLTLSRLSLYLTALAKNKHGNNVKKDITAINIS